MEPGEPEEPSARGRGRIPDWAWMLVPVLIFLALHLRSLHYEFVWTDQAEIEHGTIIRPPGAILAAFGEPMWPSLEKIAPGAAQPYYRPLPVVLVSLVDFHMGRRPANFRAFSLAAGALSMAAFALLVWMLIGDPRWAALAASIVAAHPGGIENYVWIAGLSTALCHLFIVCSLLGVAALHRSIDAGESHQRQSIPIGLSCFAFVLALLSKDGAIIAPLLALALASSLGVMRTPNAGGQLGVADAASGIALPRGPMATLIVTQFAIAAVYMGVVRPLVLGGVLSGAPPIAGDMGVHLVTVLTTWLDRLLWLFAPLSSSTSDVIALNRSIFQPLFLIGVALLVSAPIVWYWLLRRRKGLAAFGWAWMWIAFLPTSGLVPLTHVVAVRYLSFSVFGVSLLWLVLLPRLGARFDPPLRGRVVWALAILLVAFLGERSADRVPDWQSDRVLFGGAVERDPLYREGHYVLAVDRFEAGDFEQAKRHINDLRVAEGAFGNHWSFLRKADAIMLLCRINLALELAHETLPLFGGELRPDAAAITKAPALMECAARSLEQVGRRSEALRIREALEEAHGGG